MILSLLMSLAGACGCDSRWTPSAGGILIDYASFMVLLGALFIISGGIYIKGEFAGTPLVNTVFSRNWRDSRQSYWHDWRVDAADSSLSPSESQAPAPRSSLCLLYIRGQQYRRAAHAARDPPLFLGFLRGVPFGWTLSLLPIWLATLVPLLIVFNLYDQYVFVREDVETPGALAEDVQPRRHLDIQCGLNPIFLLGVIASAILSGYFGWPRGVQEVLMIAMAVLSWVTTPPSIHKANHFHLHPIAEVAGSLSGNLYHDDSCARDSPLACDTVWPQRPMAVLLDVRPPF
jgi:hypothetical protein